MVEAGAGVELAGHRWCLHDRCRVEELVVVGVRGRRRVPAASGMAGLDGKEWVVEGAEDAAGGTMQVQTGLEVLLSGPQVALVLRLRVVGCEEADVTGLGVRLVEVCRGWLSRLVPAWRLLLLLVWWMDLQMYWQAGSADL